jgi:hypothetical protein
MPPFKNGGTTVSLIKGIHEYNGFDFLKLYLPSKIAV